MCSKLLLAFSIYCCPALDAHLTDWKLPKMAANLHNACVLSKANCLCKYDYVETVIDINYIQIIKTI